MILWLSKLGWAQAISFGGLTWSQYCSWSYQLMLIVGWDAWVIFHMDLLSSSWPDFASLNGKIRAVCQEGKGRSCSDITWYNMILLCYILFVRASHRQAQIQGVNLERRNYKELMAIFNLTPSLKKDIVVYRSWVWRSICNYKKSHPEYFCL